MRALWCAGRRSLNRYAGFQAALKDYPEVEMIDMQVASWSQDQAMNFTQTGWRP